MAPWCINLLGVGVWPWSQSCRRKEVTEQGDAGCGVRSVRGVWVCLCAEAHSDGDGRCRNPQTRGKPLYFNYRVFPLPSHPTRGQSRGARFRARFENKRAALLVAMMFMSMQVSVAFPPSPFIYQATASTTPQPLMRPPPPAASPWRSSPTTGNNTPTSRNA